MFENIGGKIKGLAATITWIGIFISVVGGIALIASEAALAGILVAAIGSLLSWISSFLLYGFGQLVENSDQMVELLKNNKSKSCAAPQSTAQSYFAQPAAPVAPQASTAPRAPMPTAAAGTPLVPKTDETDPNFIICPKCATRQRSNRSICFNCGERFKKD